MGEPKLKMIKLSTPEIYGILADLNYRTNLGFSIAHIERINIELNLETNTGNIIIVPKDETLIKETP